MTSFLRIVGTCSTVVLGGLLAVACGSSSEDTPRSFDPFVEEYCRLLAPCCAAQGSSPNVVGCAEARSGGAYRPEMVDQCLADLKAETVDGTSCPVVGAPANSLACFFVFSTVAFGTLSPGEPCKSSFDCAWSSVGDVSCAQGYGTTDPEMCVVEVHAQAGEPCIATRFGNAIFHEQGSLSPTVPTCFRRDGLICDSGSRTCVPLAKAGATCNDMYGCVDSAWCDLANDVCIARIPVGAACTPDDECEHGSWCDPATQKCAPRKAKGAACSDGDECLSKHCESGACALGLLIIDACG